MSGGGLEGMKINKDNTIGIKMKPLHNCIGASKCFKDDWTMVAFVIPRKQLNSNFIDVELQYNSIYFLIGYEGLVEKVYIGQAKKRNGSGSVLNRLREHDKSMTEKYKDIWDYAVVITSTNDTWGPTELNTLEHLFYNEVKEEYRLNGNTPNLGGVDNDIDYNEKIKQAKSYIKAINFKIFDDIEDSNNLDTMQVEAVLENSKTVERLQNPWSRIPEIITPQNVVKYMVDTIPEEKFNKDSKFLDLACKGGEYLREIYERLMKTESIIAYYNDVIERSNHILNNQLYGIALSSISLDRTTKNLKGFGYNIRVIDEYMEILKGRHKKSIIDVIREEFGNNMEFDIVIGNPPYQEATTSIYQHFINNAIDLSDNICMVTKDNWMVSDTLKDTRSKMIKAGIKDIISYPEVGELFKGVTPSVTIFNICKNTKETTFKMIKNSKIVSEYKAELKEGQIILDNIIEQRLFEKMIVHSKHNFGECVEPSECFRITPNGEIGRTKIPLDDYTDKSDEHNITVIYMDSNKKPYYRYIKPSDIPAKSELAYKYKVVSGRIISKDNKVIRNINLTNNMSVCASSWTVLFSDDNKDKAINALN